MISQNIIIKMEETIFSSPNSDGQIIKLEIKQKNAYIRKRKVKTWTPEQDERLVELHEQYPKKWGIVASLMNDRNQNQCLHRFRRLSQQGARKKIWSPQQDAAILSMTKKVGKNWKLLSQLIGTKTGKQIRERFINKLDPKIRFQQWTDQQDKLILKYYSELGSRWSEISKKLPGRPENKIKNRFYSYIQKNYDLKYTVLASENQNKNNNKQCHNIHKNQASNLPLQQVSLNSKINKLQFDCLKAKKQDYIDSKRDLPSIRDLDQYKLGEMQKDQIFDSSIHFGHKFYIKSLIKMDEQIIDNRYKSIRDLVSKGDLQQQNDFFYLSQQ